MNLAPITLFVYNRPEHTKKTVEALQKNKLAQDSELYIFSDAAKNKDAEIEVEEVRNYIKTINGFKKITITERERNLGLAKSIISGVIKIVNKHDKIIVLEDDLITSPYFLKYMNDALNVYKDEEQVMHISGYFFPIKNNLPKTFFYNQTSCWGWATWKRAWNHFNSDTKKLYDEIKNKNLINKFNIEGANKDFEQQLIANINDKINTWAIKWQASVFLNNGLCLHTNKSLVNNVGFDGSGVNCDVNDNFDVEIFNSPIKLSDIPLEENKKARLLMKKYYKRIKNSSGIKKIIKKFILLK